MLRRHLTDDQRGMMGALWMKEHPALTGAAAHGKSAPRGADLEDSHPTRATDDLLVYICTRRLELF